MSLPSFFKLSRAALARRDVVRCIVRRSSLVPRHAVAETTHAFALTEDELSFARTLLSLHSQMWLYRTHQRGFAGDFVVVDLSSPEPTRRRVFAVELKRGHHVRVHDGTPLQLRNASLVVSQIARTGVVDDDSPHANLTGDSRAVVAYLASRGRSTPCPLK